MTLPPATKSFEHWLLQQTPLVQTDLRHKHIAMRADIFSFLRATYYRYAQQFPDLPAKISAAPKTLCVGDLHIENFGTWRDAIGRLAWGINDFDEAYPLPYTHDLVRLAVSTLIAIDLNHLRATPKAACRAILEGYRQGIADAGRPFIIGDEHRWFKPILLTPARDPGLFWDHLRDLPKEKSPLPKHARKAIQFALPNPKLSLNLHHRIAGLGNLGKPRYTALAHYQGGPVAREAKALTLSAAAWAISKSDGPYYHQILSHCIRSCDPYLKVHGNWIVRRLAPDCRRIELSSLSRVPDEEWLLHAMGHETANVHLGTPTSRRPISQHLKNFPPKQLRKSAMTLIDTITTDFRASRR